MAGVREGAEVEEAKGRVGQRATRPGSGHLLAMRAGPVETGWLLGPHPLPTGLLLPNRFS